MNDQLESRIRSLSDKELYEVLKKPDDYIPEALNYALEEIQRRGGWDEIEKKVLPEISKEKIEIIKEQKENERASAVRQTEGITYFLARIISGIISLIAYGLYEIFIQKYESAEWAFRPNRLIIIICTILLWRMLIPVIAKITGASLNNEEVKEDSTPK